MADEEQTDKPAMSHWHAPKMEATGKWGEKRRLATAMRLVIDRLVRSDAPEEELRVAADRLEQYAEHLAGHPPLLIYEGFAETATAGDVGAFFDQSPMIGRANPLAPPIHIEKTGDKCCEAHVTFGAAYEGPPGCVHGGFIAAAFDEVLGFAQSLTGSPGFTGTLKVIYRKPTPLHTDLRFECEVAGVDGRKIYATGRVYAGDLMTAEAEGIFISADREKFRALLEDRLRREAERAGK